MSETKFTSAQRAYRKGLWMVRIWPLIANLLVIGGITYAVIMAILPLEVALIVAGAVVLISMFWGLRQRGAWRTWMVKHSENPKTSLELARTSFLKSEALDKVALWSLAKRTSFQEEFDARMNELRATHLEAASQKYDKFPTINVYHKFSGLLWVLLFELLVVAGVVYLFMQQEDMTIKIILSVLVLIGLGGIWYTIKTIWRRNTTVIEISKHGIRIEDKYFGWMELNHIDIVRGDTLEYQKNGESLQQLKIKNLSLSADYLDELILFYRTKSNESV